MVLFFSSVSKPHSVYGATCQFTYFDYFHCTIELMSFILLINCILSHDEKGDELMVQFQILRATLTLFFILYEKKEV